MLRVLARGLILYGVIFAVGCGTLERAPGSASVPIDSEPDYTDVSKPGTPVTPPAPEREPVIGAAQTLLIRADQASFDGDFERALALLERAQRIDPSSGQIYLSLATTYRAKGDLDMASAAAQRGMLYCRDDRECGALRKLVSRP